MTVTLSSISTDLCRTTLWIKDEERGVTHGLRLSHRQALSLARELLAGVETFLTAEDERSALPPAG